MDNITEWLDVQLRLKDPGTRLPTDLELAQEFNISTSTVARRLRPFIKEKKITRIRGKGTFIGSGTVSASPKTRTSSSEQVAAMVRTGILSGEFKSGDILPSLTEIRYRFKVSYKTAIQAYRLLEKEEMISKAGKSFWVGTVRDLTHPPRRKQVYLFNYRTPDFTDLYLHEAMGIAYQRMEREFNLNGFLVRYHSTDDLTRLAGEWVKTRNNPDGLIFCFIDRDRYRKLGPLLKMTLEKIYPWTPPVLFDWGMGRYEKQVPNGILFARGNIISTSSRALTRYLCQQQFGKAVIFMNEGYATWSFTNTSLILFRVYWEIFRQDPGFNTSVVVKPHTFTKGHVQWLKDKKIPLQCLVHGREVFRNLREEDVKKVTDPIPVTKEFSAYFEHFRDVPVWIFSRDEEAARAMAWAQNKGIRIPENLSVITLQNDPRYFHLGLSYCGPDWDTIGYQMAHAIIKDYPVARTSKGFLKTKAGVIEKLTTR